MDGYASFVAARLAVPIESPSRFFLSSFFSLSLSGKNTQLARERISHFGRKHRTNAGRVRILIEILIDFELI